MMKTSGLVVAVLAVLAIRPAVSIAHDPASHDTAMETQGQPSGRSIYNLDEAWTTQEGVTAPLASLAGKPVVAAMGYTTCKDMCPAIVADMMWIEKHLPAGAADRVRFAFFSLDSETDTPERLRLYAESHGLDTTRWTLLQGGGRRHGPGARGGVGSGLSPRWTGRLRPRRCDLADRREGRDRCSAARNPGEFERASRRASDSLLEKRN